MLIWSLKVSRLSIVRSSKTTLEDYLIIILMFSMIDCLVLLPRTINGNFSGLGFTEFILNHFDIFCISYFRSFKIVCRVILQLDIVLSSAKSHIFILLIKRKRSLINKLKNNEPKIEPCGAPQLYLYHSNHYNKNLFLFFAYNLLGSYVSNLIYFYQYHRLQILQQEDH